MNGGSFGAGTLLLLFVAGVGAGVTGSTAGLASLISYPALLAVGLPPVTANVTNTVALIGSSIGSVSGSMAELRGQVRDVRRYAGLAVLAGAAGAAVLLVGSPGAFEGLVPYLIASASVLLLFSPRLRAIRAGRSTPGAGAGAVTGAGAGAVTGAGQVAGAGAAAHRGPLVPVGLFLTCLYGGYFGAAAGVMILALLLFATDKTLPAANALKNLLLGIANAVAAVGFLVFADVRLVAVVPLGLGCVVGGRIGPAIVRRVPPAVLRTLIALAGFGLSIRLWLS